jgi:hypothetical protein
MHLDKALKTVSAFVEPSQFESIRRHIPPAWVEQALEVAGTATVRRRRLPAEQVVWLVVGMAMFRRWPIHDLVGKLDLVLPGPRATVVPSTVAEARARVGAEPLEQIFEMGANKWGHESARRHAWRGLAMYGVDGSRGGYRSHPREMIAEIRDNRQLDWSHSFVVEEGNDVTSPLSSRRLSSDLCSAVCVLTTGGPRNQ